MTTNQTIDGVPRGLLEAFAAYVADSPNAIMRARAKELRALLDAPAKNAFACWSCKKPVTMSERADADGNCPHCDVELDIEDWPFPSGLTAAQPQGEPVAMMNDGREGEPCIWFSRPPSGTKLYAEQPAPLLAEAREWLGDGKNSDGLAREHWTPEYAALIDRIDATLRK